MYELDKICFQGRTFRVRAERNYWHSRDVLTVGA